MLKDRDKVCVYCGTDKELHRDHIFPRKRGGQDIFINLVLACQSCNSSKGDKEIYEWCKQMGFKVPDIIKEQLNKQYEQKQLLKYLKGST